MEELQGMYPRLIEPELSEMLNRHPVVGLLGPRQVGKTTLALAAGESRPSLYLDLESPSDLAKLADEIDNAERDGGDWPQKSGISKAIRGTE